MKRLLISTTALAVALAGVPPFPVMAQETECVAGQECPAPDDKAAKKAAKKAEKEKAKTESGAAGNTAEEEAAKAAKKAEREAAKAAEKAKAEEAAATPPSQPAPAPAPVPEVTTTQPAPEPAPAAEPVTDDKAEKKAKKKAEKAEAAAADGFTAPDDTATTTGAADTAETAAGAAEEAAKAEKKAAKKAANAEAEAGTVTGTDTGTEAATPAPEPTPEAEAALSSILVRPSERDDSGAAPAAAAAAADTTGATGSDAAPVATTETVLTEENTRSSREEFRRGDNNGNGNGNNNNNNFGNGVNSGENRGNELGVNSRDENERDQKREKFRDRDEAAVEDDDDGLSDFEKFGLVALGALAVGMILKNGDRVVQNTGDRVVVSRSDGTYQVWRDDDTLIREPGSTVRTETFNDGSTRTTVTRDDGSRIVTIRDVSGRVLRRSLIDTYGRETLLIDDLRPVQPIDVTTLPRRPEITLSASNDATALEAALASARAGNAAGGYSLAQVRDVREVRALAPRIEVTPITFASGSAAIDPSEAEKLAELGGLVARMAKERPNELFLIEGHTDAVGDAASNLALSDRRAESVALALTEYFDVPPENLVVQGYGEGDLLVPTLVSEPRNRRVAVRVITPLLAAAR